MKIKHFINVNVFIRIILSLRLHLIFWLLLLKLRNYRFLYFLLLRNQLTLNLLIVTFKRPSLKYPLITSNILFEFILMSNYKLNKNGSNVNRSQKSVNCNPK